MNKKLIHTVIDAAAQQYPNNEAIVTAVGSSTYQELRDMSNSMANVLLALHTGRETIVCTLLDAGIPLATSMLGIFKAGGIYLPTIKTFTIARWKGIFRDLSPKVMITTSDKLKWFDNNESAWSSESLCYIILLNVEGKSEKVYKQENGQREEIAVKPSSEELPDLSVKEEDGAYIFFTSGTTGSGKAFLGQHKSLSHFIHWQKNEFEIGSNTKVSQISQITFDASLRDFLLPLAVGATLCIPQENIRNNPARLIQWLAETKINVVHTVPSVFRLLIKAVDGATQPLNLDGLKWMFLAGEALFGRDLLTAREQLGPQVTLINLYGTSETTMAKTFFLADELPESEDWKVPVGKPISNTVIAVINNDRACTKGEIGEVFIKTPFITKGYLGNSKLNDAVFVQNPLVKDKPDIIYKTGDLGRINGNGDLEVLGRMDDQIKLNGIRTHVNDIESEILTLPQIGYTVLVPVKDPINGDTMICYYTGTETPSEMFVAQLKEKLEEPLIPHFFIHLDEMPLGVNGKVDRKILPKPQELILRKMDYVPPVGEWEEITARLYQEILNYPKVGRNMSFFKLGGTSLKAMQLIARILRELHVEVELREVYENQTPEVLARLIQTKEKVAYEAITKIGEAEYYPLSYGQRRLWVTCQLEQEHSAYNMVEASLFLMKVDKFRFDYALRDLVARHEVLRTVFKEKGGEIFQHVIPIEHFDCETNYQDFSANEQARAKVEAAIEYESTRRFDFKKGPLFRISLLKLDEETYVYIFVIHHIICDGWSLEVLLRDFLQIYNNLSEKRQSILPELNLQYRDYANWQLNQQDSNKWLQMERYWLNKFSIDIPVIDLPLTYSRTKKKTSRGSKEQIVVDGVLFECAQKLIDKSNTSDFVFLLAVVKCLLYRYSHQETIIVGSPVAGRTRQELEGQVGFYANTLAFLTRINGQESFDTLLQQVRQTVIEGMDYQDYPFDLLIDKLQVERETGRSPLFDVMVVLQDTHQVQGNTRTGKETPSVESYPVDKHAAKFDLTFTFSITDQQFILNLEYSTELFSPDMIKSMLGHFNKLLEAIVSNSDGAVEAFNYLGEEEKQYLLTAFKGAEFELPDKLWYELFENQVLHSPDHIAVKCGEELLSYQQLNVKANQLAHYLRDRVGVKQGDFVVFLAERDHWLIVSLLALAKVGAVYVPVDPNYPADRIGFILDDAQAGVILTDVLRTTVPLEGHIQIVNYNDDWTEISRYSNENIPVAQTGMDLSYMIYTSGSTGNPKGVMVEHRGMLNHLYAKINDLKIDRETVLAQNASQSFDISIWQAVAALMSGGTTIVYDNEAVLDPESFITQVEQDQVTILEVVPSYLDNLLEIMEIEGVRETWSKLIYLMVTGEAVQASVLRHWFNVFPQTPVVNAYGPTEASDDITHHFMFEAPSNTNIPVGKTVQNLNIYILDANQHLCPLGVKGEICVSGIGVGRGYLNRDELTKKVFTSDPFDNGQKLYRTGDLGRFLPDGTLEFYGRLDSQVKVRGYRIELGEIENKCSSIKGIRQIAVLLQQDEQNQNYIAAYATVENGSGMTADDIKVAAERNLPHYMVPAMVLILDAMPVTPNGKIDRKMLAKTGEHKPIRREISIPTNETEEKLLEIWKKLLGNREIGITDNFFEIGGHSLRATRMLSFIYKEFNVRLDLRFIFDNPSIDKITRKIISSDQVLFQEIKALPVQSLYVASNAQLRFWLIDQREKVNNHYNVSTSHVMEGKFKKEIFQKAFEKVIERHEILRTKFGFKDDHLIQEVVGVETSGFTIEFEDYRERPNAEEDATANLDELSRATFDLKQLPLMKGRIVQVADERYFFLLVMPHIITDGWSMQILLKEVLTFYNTITRGLPAPFSPLEIQYRDYADWHNKQLEGDNLADLEHYWLTKLNKLPVIELPVDSPRVDRTAYTGKSIAYQMDMDKTKQLQDLSYQYESSVYMTYLASFYTLLHFVTNQNDLVVGTPIAGRTHPDLESIIGCFINIMPVRLRFSESMTFRELVHHLKKEFIDDSERQTYPLEMMIQKLNSKEFSRRNQLFDVVFIFQNTQLNLEEVEEMDHVKVSTLHLENVISRLDLEVVVTEVEDEGITTVFNYNVDLLSEERVSLMMDKFKRIVEIVLDSPDIKLNHLAEVLEEQLSNENGTNDLDLSLEMNF